MAQNYLRQMSFVSLASSISVSNASSNVQGSQTFTYAEIPLFQFWHLNISNLRHNRTKIRRSASAKRTQLEKQREKNNARADLGDTGHWTSARRKRKVAYLPKSNSHLWG